MLKLRIHSHLQLVGLILIEAPFASTHRNK